METKKEEVLLELGSVIYEAILENCWEQNPNTVSISSLNQSIALLKVEIYLLRFSKSVESFTSNCSQLQLALQAFLIKHNIVLSSEMNFRLTKIQKHFTEKM